jgi:uncharacterized membrane protein YfcA
MQLTIAAFTAGAYLMLYRSIAPAAVFFVVMQVGAVFGAYWGARLKSRTQSRVW